MNAAPTIGTLGEERFVVSEQHLIDFSHDGRPQFLWCAVVGLAL
jgi:hypothetical protein